MNETEIYFKEALKWRELVRFARDVEYIDSQSSQHSIKAVAQTIYEKLIELCKEEGE